MNNCSNRPSFELGNIVQMNVQFVDSNGTPADPDTVTLRVKNPDNTVSVYTYPATVEKVGTGDYFYQITTDQAGVVFYRWEGSGAVVATGEGQFEVTPSNVL